MTRATAWTVSQSYGSPVHSATCCTASRRAGLKQQELGEAIGYSLEQVASVEQGRRPAKAAFTSAADRALDAGGVLEVLQDEVDRAKLPRFFRNFALIEAEVVSRFSYDPDGLRWFKSSYSGSDGGDCVEVAVDRGTVRVRDSKVAGAGPVLRVGRDGWSAFVGLAAA